MKDVIYLTAKEASERVKLSEAYLAKLRHSGGSCRFFRASSKVILYRLDELEEWLEKRSFLTTSRPAHT